MRREDELRAEIIDCARVWAFKEIDGGPYGPVAGQIRQAFRELEDLEAGSADHEPSEGARFVADLLDKGPNAVADFLEIAAAEDSIRAGVLLGVASKHIRQLCACVKTAGNKASVTTVDVLELATAAHAARQFLEDLDAELGDGGAS